MLLGIQIQKVEISYEKCLIFNPDCKGVRLDVYANDENNTRYDIEMQVAEQELGKRIRYYHSQMDMELLERGHNYKELPAAYVIFICDFDPFKLGKYCYTFENRCIEELALKLHTKIQNDRLGSHKNSLNRIEKQRALLKYAKNQGRVSKNEIDLDFLKKEDLVIL